VKADGTKGGEAEKEEEWRSKAFSKMFGFFFGGFGFNSRLEILS